MSGPFRHIIPAAPGTRVIEMWGDSIDMPELVQTPVIAWAETETRPGRLQPVVDDGEAFAPVEMADFYVDILYPGEELRPGTEEYVDRVRIYLGRKKGDGE